MIIRTYLLYSIWSKILFSSRDAMLKLSETTSLQKLFPSDCFKLFLPLQCHKSCLSNLIFFSKTRLFLRIPSFRIAPMTLLYRLRSCYFPLKAGFVEKAKRKNIVDVGIQCTFLIHVYQGSRKKNSFLGLYTPPSSLGLVAIGT